MRLTVPAGPPQRLDQFLIAHRVEGSRRRARELIAAGGVRVNERRARKGQLVRAGEVVTIDAAATQVCDLAGEPDLPVEILFADDAVIALNKPAGMPSTARRPGDHGTVANFLLGRFPEVRALPGRPLDAGLVHRLDTGTSGLLLAARTGGAQAALRRQFQARAIDKYYLALVAGEIDRPRAVASPIGHAPRRPRRMLVCARPVRATARSARPAETTLWPLRRAHGVTLIAVRLRTGVRHQIRVHLASIRHPLIGDPLYGADADTFAAAPRLLLHAWQLRLIHPVSGASLQLRAAAPADLRGVLETLAWREPPPPQWDELVGSS